MFNTALAATLNYADYALLGVSALILLACVVRGFGKSLYGFLFALVIIVGSLFLAGIAVEPLLKTSLGSQFNGAIQGWSGSWGDAFNCEVFFSNGTAVIYPAGSTQAVSLSDAVGGNAVLGWFVNTAASKIVPPEGGMSLAEVLVPNMTYIFTYLILLILMVIGLKLVLRLVDKLWDKVTHEGTRNKALDKFMGVPIAVLYAGALVFFVFAIMGMLAEKSWMQTAVLYIRQSMLASWLFDNNPLLPVFLRLFVG